MKNTRTEGERERKSDRQRDRPKSLSPISSSLLNTQGTCLTHRNTEKEFSRKKKKKKREREEEEGEEFKRRTKEGRRKPCRRRLGERVVV